MERHIRPINRVFATGDQAQLIIESRNGEVAVREHDLPEVQVNAFVTVNAPTAQDAETEFQAVEAGIRADEDRVSITTPPGQVGLFQLGRSLEVRLEVIAPRGARAQVTARNGRIAVRNIAGPANIDSRNGSVLVEGVQMGGSLVSHNGRVEVTKCGGSFDVSSHNGDVRIEDIDGDVSSESHNGDILARDISGTLTLRCHNGTLRYSGAVVADVDLEVMGSGSIRLDLPPDSRFALDAEAVRGSVTSDLPVSDHAPSADPRPNVRLRTVNGTIRIGSLTAGARL